jgi:hypothetical protein
LAASFMRSLPTTLGSPLVSHVWATGFDPWWPNLKIAVA